MPSYDANGKRLHGAAQVKKAKENQAIVKAGRKVIQAERIAESEEPISIPAAFIGLTEPPIVEGVAAVEHWAAGLNLRAAMAAETADITETFRVAAVLTIMRELGKLKDKAARSEKGLQLRGLRLDGEVVSDIVTSELPPYDDPVAIVCWSFMRLASMAYAAANAEEWRPTANYMASIKGLSAVGFLPCNGALKEVATKVRKQG
jgi:hypothetical protein